MRPHALEMRPGRAAGVVDAVPSKSVTHRAFLLAAQSDLPCTVRRPSMAEDPRAMLGALLALGARVHLDPDRPEAVQFLPAALRPPTTALDCRNAGTALRLLAATAARLPVPVTLTGDASLRSRPNGPLLDALRALGARVTADGDRAPLTVHGPLRPGPVRLDATQGSQPASALLLALPFLPGPSTLHLTGPPASRPYLDLTLDVAARFGVAWRPEGGDGQAWATDGGATARASHVDVEGDWSAAAFLLAAAAVTAGDVTVRGLRANSPQGDRAVVDHLRAFGCRLDVGEDAVRCRSDGTLVAPGRIDLRGTPDLAPPLAAVAACAQGTTTFTGAAHLRHKESDRIAALTDGLAAFGIGASPLPDGLVVTGGRPRGARVACRGDHRVHMAFAVLAAAAAGPSRLDGADTVAVSHPSFHAELAVLGLDARPLHGNQAVVAG